MMAEKQNKTVYQRALRVALCMGMAIWSMQVWAGIDPEIKSIYTLYQGTSVVLGQPEAEMTLSKNAPGFASYDRVALNRITLRVDQQYKKHFSAPMKVEVKMDVERWDVNQNQLADTTIWLTIRYNPYNDSTYISEESARFSGSYQMHVVLDEIKINGTQNDTLPANLRVDAEILVDRYTSLLAPNNGIQLSAINAIDQNCNDTIDGIEVVWPNIPGAMEYQLEWVYINNYGSDITNPSALADMANLSYNFKYNATRISTSSNSYIISHVFDQGYILFRVRPVGIILPDLITPVFGPWGAPDNGVVQGFSASYEIQPNQRHEKLKNWQYSATYAEEGKKKEIISYFDGSLRNRQTVTRINSDENIIVGETIYDHQGRPAINILPVPVVDPSCQDQMSQATLQYYPNFNRNVNGEPYSRSDFDLSNPETECAVLAAPMDTSSGASRYYSPNNPDQNNWQAYVPDAHQFPFTQVEYTPDNTGRIRRQSGVGTEFQLGSGHETKYLYGQPNQLELDRLFGSEVGYAEHYKKNVVIDAHGQASISYVDQQDHVIATALAGNAPQNLNPLDSALQNPVLLQVNAFGDNNSQNLLSIEGDALVFSTEILVPFESDYTFDYNFSIAPLQEECLPNICIDCIYELKLELVDECGTNLAADFYQTGLVGKFTDNGSNGYSFHATCTNPLNSTPNIQPFTVTALKPGSYSLNKRLTISSEARQAYLDLYFNDSINNCIKTYQDFEDEALANTDFSGCQEDCESCLENLGSLEDFVAQGRGSANDYNLQKEDCDRICNEGKISFCETVLSAMQMDMSPDGQYGNVTDFGDVLSLYNPNNQLPIITASWHNPSLIDSYGAQPIYVEMNGDTSKITVEPLGNNTWSPAILAGATPKFDSIQQVYYVYPQELQDVSDFIANFRFSWAKSLVYYHPEYPYYEQCIKFSQNVNSSDAFTSDSFDELLNGSQGFEAAIGNGLLPTGYQIIFDNNGNYSGSVSGLPDTENWFAPSGNNIATTTPAWDPFVFYGTNFSAASCANYGTELVNRFNQYKLINGVWRTMPEVAAYTARCGTNYYTNPSNTCFNFGDKYNGVYNISILNAEWEILKAIYRSEKQVLKSELFDCVAKANNQYTGCIGKENYNPYTSGMINSNGGSSSFLNSPYFLPDQPCGAQLWALYQNKARRFTTVADEVPTQNPNQAAYEVYLATGQCPVPFNLQLLLNAMADDQVLDNSGVFLSGYAELNALFQANNNYNMPGTLPQLYQQVSGNANSITAQWIENSGLTTYATLTLSTQNPISWDQITAFTNLQTVGGSNFTATAVYNTGGTSQSTTIYGSLTTFDLSACSFENDCTQNEFGVSMQQLLSNLAATQQLVATTPIDIDPLPVGTNTITGSQTNLVVNAAQCGSNLHWVQTAPNAFKLFDPAGSSIAGLYLTFTEGPSGYNWSNLASITYFDNLISAGQHLFEVQAYINTGSSVLLKGKIIRLSADSTSTGLKVGECDLPLPAECQTKEHKAFESLGEVLKDLLQNQALATNTNLDLYSSIYLESELTQQFSTGTSSSTSSLDSIQNTLHIQAGDCEIQLQAPAAFPLQNIVSISTISVAGETTNQFNYNQFELTALFAGANDTLVEGIITGSAPCLALQECFGCLPQALTIDEHEQIRQQRLLTEDYFLDNSMQKYDAYALAIDSLNVANNVQPGDSLYVTKKPYTYFSKNGFQYPTPSLLRYFQHFVPGQDSLSFIQDPDKFVANYGYGTNVLFEFERYTEAINQYNIRATNLYMQTLLPLNKTTFVNALVARETGSYIIYLDSLPLANYSTQDILTFLGADTLLNSSNEQLYRSYTDTYLQFESNQINGIGAQCPDYAKLSPMYAIEDLQENNLFCSTSGIQDLNDYIDQLSVGCPPLFPYRADCQNMAETKHDKAEQQLYILYKEAVKSFNMSFWATSNAVVLPLYITSSTQFKMSELTLDCIKQYMQYLKTYTASSNAFDPAVPPLSIAEFGPCAGTLAPEEPCKEAYSQYIDCIQQFNDWAKNNAYDYSVVEVAKYEAFLKADACNCVGEFCARLQNIKDGLIQFQDENEFYFYLDPSQVCKEPCQPQTTGGLMDSAITVEVIDDCYEMLYNLATTSAQLNYQLYKDSLSNVLINRYNSHCLAVQESFSYTYLDKLYHFTLYYYDQAGNLIKTIPPEGVQRLNTTASNDPVSVQIANDRSLNQKTVFTSHNLATRYEYNSLNQLVAQSSPDTDPMDIFELTLPNGLHNRLVTQKIQMVNENEGYLAGEVLVTTNSASINRGYLYKTQDGGHTWNRVYGTVGSNIQKTTMLTSNIGFAVGSEGVILKTTDGGQSWDLLNTWSTTGMITDWNDITYSANLTGNFTVTAIGKNGAVARSTDLQTFALANTGINTTHNLTSITHDGQHYYITADNPANGTSSIYRSAFNPISWSLFESFAAPKLKTIDRALANRAFAAGEDGRLYMNEDITNGNNRWKIIDNNLTQEITDIQFFNNDQGIAVANGKLYRTLNGGALWSLESSDNFTHLSESADGSSVLAVGSDSKIRLVVNSINPNTPLIPIVIPQVGLAIQAGWVDRQGSGITSSTALVIAAGSELYITLNGQAANPIWANFDLSTSTNNESIKDLKLERSGSIIRGMILTENGTIVRFNSALAATGVNVSTANNPTLCMDKEESSPYVYMLRSDGTIVRNNIQNNSNTCYNAASGVSTPHEALVVKGNFASLVGDKIALAELNGGTSALNADLSTKTSPAILTKVKYLNGSLIAIGTDGILYKWENNQWNLKSTATNRNLYAVGTANNQLYLAGEQGFFSSAVISNNNCTTVPMTLTNAQTVDEAVTENLLDMAFNGNKMYVVGQNGRVLYSPDHTSMAFANLQQGTQNLNGISAIPGTTKMLTVGNKNTIIEQAASNFMVKREIFIPALRDVHFANATNGTLLGGNFTIRKTNDGGASWYTVKPTTATAPGGNYTEVITLDQNRSLILGQGTAINSVGNQAQTFTASPNPNQATDVQLKNNNVWVLNSSAVLKYHIPTNTWSTLTSLPSSANAIEVFDNESFAVAGNNGLFRYYSNTGALISSANISGQNIRDLQFIDKSTGVAVGDNGAYYKTTNNPIDQNGYMTATSWLQQVGVFNNNVDPYLVNAANQININTITFASPTKAIIGGSYTAAFSQSAPAHCYVRNVFDPNARYSSRFFYDKLGRLVVSQNARQYNLVDVFGQQKPRKFSYTRYDALGRVVEVGEKTENSDPTLAFKSIFGTMVADYYNPIAIDDSKLEAWINGTGERREVTRSYYDTSVYTNIANLIPNPLTQRKRIVHVTYEELWDANEQTYDHATHYDYDIHGNVKTLIQDNKKMAQAFASLASQRFKRMDYKYDLISGNVHRMSAQDGQMDQWHHAYQYDADNRIIAAYTTNETPILQNSVITQTLENELVQNSDWEKDAAYNYYDHGPLARTEIGEVQLQGFDYIYNLQGWMKGINAIENEKDPGQDGLLPNGTINNPNALFAKDAGAFSLEYFNSDYQSISGSVPISTVASGSHPAANSAALYNGNIRYMQTRLTNVNTHDAMPMLNAYKYDQLNRLNESRSYESGLASNAWNPSSYNNAYYNAFTYDAMGNILTQQRHKRDGTKIEEMSYKYQYANGKLQRNRLYHINDAVSASVDNTDIDDQGTFDPLSTNINQNNNYKYDEEGRLVRDIAEDIAKITWRVDGKVKEIQRGADTSTRFIRFDYDAMGHRIAKHVYDNTGTILKKSTYYILDAQGNQISMYEHEVQQEMAEFNIVERNIFGSSRLGSRKDKINLLAQPQDSILGKHLGHKNYEFSNHLGNVLIVFTDVKTPIDTDSDGTVDLYRVCLQTITDYSPFGVALDGRTMQGDGYRYSFQGQEHDDEVKGDGNSVNYKFRMHDPRVGRFFAVDPLAEKYAAVSPYVYCLGNPIKYNDLDGRWVPGADKDNNVLLTKEEGDTKKSLAKFMGNEYSKKEINKLWKSRNKGTGVIDLTKQVGGVFQEMKTAMTESQARNNPINTDYDVVPNRLGGKNMTNNYNCWGTCIALNDGKKLETGVGINTGAEFDTKLSTGYSPTTQDVATVGKTVVRYADVSNVVQHGAIFMGVDNSGNGYLFSKNGWAVQPEIHTTDYIKNFVSDYGTIKGINAGETGYYNKK